jgi:hypothetical protein
MPGYDIFRGQKDNAPALRQMAAESRQRSEESFARSDTDGFLSQWASDITAQQLDKQAEIAEQRGRDRFQGLYEGDRRVSARLIFVPCYNAPWRTEPKWELRGDECRKFNRAYIPYSVSWKKGSTIQRKLGLSQKIELAPAEAILGGKGKGLSGCASAFVTSKRTGCEWGSDAQLVNNG